MTIRAWFHRLSLLGIGCFTLSTLESCASSSNHTAARDAAAPDTARDASLAPTMACKQDGDCDDGTYCDGVESCVKGLCAPGKPVKCDDGLACTTDGCAEARRACAFLPPDRDADGHYDRTCKGKDGKPLGDDCDDNDSRRFPGNIEVCDPKHHDEDCDPNTTGAKDSDGDGFIDAQCCNPDSDAPNAKLHCGDDCDDLKKNVNPKASEVCDGFDNNCNGETDEGVTVMMYPDRDFDGHGSTKLDKSWDCKGVKSEYLQRVPKKVCAGEKGYSPYGDDCNDCDPNIYPGQLEICDGKDNDCNGKIDERHEQARWYPDVDGDGFGDLNAASPAVVTSCEPVKAHVLLATDCDDHDAARNPAADELCDGKDNDCRNGADYKIRTNDFEDDDGDQIADFQCGAGANDCDDNDPTTGAGDAEICDQRDNDCDGAIDEGVTSTVWYLDRDGDGYGDDTAPQEAYCGVIPGRVALPGDCDDTNPTIHPHAIEICDNINQDCDSQTDEAPADAQCSFPHASAYCARGSCRVDLCNPGYHDCDGDPSNGCEAHVASCSTVASGNGGAGGAGGGGGSGSGGTPGPILPIDCLGGTTTHGDVTISGTDFSALSGVHCLNGSLHVTGVGTTDLAPLSALQWIGGGLTIDSNAQLVTLAGLDSLTTIRGGLNLSSNGALKNVDGLDALTTLGGTLTIYNNVSMLNLDGLQALTSVPGNVDIEYANSLYRLALPSLQQIGGALTIYNSPGILLLDGFNALQKVGNYVSIQSNAAVTDVTGFATLTQVGGYVDIFNNSLLANVQGFAALTDVAANVRVYNNARLASLAGFGELNWVRSTLEIHDNHDLATITGFGKLTRVSGDLLIYNNPLLSTLSGFPHLVMLDASLAIQANPQLASVSGFPLLQTVQGKLTLSTNGALTAIDGMGTLQTVGDALVVQDNVALTSISGLNSGALLRLGNTLAVASNANLSRCQVDVLRARLVAAAIPFTGVDQSCCNQGCANCSGASCNGSTGGTGGTQGQSGVYTGDVTINTAADLAIFANVVQIDGNLTINGTTLPNLGGLASLQQVTGTVRIASNASMTSLVGLGALTTVGGTLNLDSNAALASIAALSSLTSVGGELRFYNNTALTSLSGLQHLVAIGGELDIEYGASLTQVDDLTGLQTIGGQLEIYNNAITHLDTWAALTSIGGIIEIQSNGALASIDGFAALTNAGSDIRILSNASLRTLDGFGTLTKLNAGNLQIHDNANLAHIGGFGALQTLPGTLEIYQDGSLNPLDGFANLTSVGSNLSIYNMASLTNVTGFAKLAEVHGVLNLNGDSALTHLSGFALLNHVYGDFTLASNAALIDVAGFPVLHDIDGAMTIADNASLASFDGISTLAHVGKDLVVARNALLADIDGLSSGTLTSIGNNLQITVNPSLLRCRVDVFKGLLAAASPGLSGTDLDSANAGCTSCSAKTCQSGTGTTNGQSGVYLGSISLSGNAVKASDLTLFRYVTSTSGNINIDSTPLTTLNGLDQLQHVGGQLRIYNNTGLATISSLSKLTAVDGGVDIEYNTFATLGGLANLASIGNFLMIYQNGALTNLDGLSKLVSVGGYLNVSSNAALTTIDGIVATATGQLVTLGGALTVQNGGLTQCATAALVASLQAHGYAGSTTTSGNLACAKTCVGTLCQ